jgi:hypothetical protein
MKTTPLLYLRLELLETVSKPDAPILRWIEYEGLYIDDQGLICTPMGGRWPFTEDSPIVLKFDTDKERKDTAKKLNREIIKKYEPQNAFLLKT